MGKGNGERRKYWEDLVREQPQSGLNVREFCRQRGVKENSFYWWRGTLLGRKTQKKKPEGFAPAAAATSGIKAPERGPSFVEVVGISHGSGVRFRLSADGTAEFCLDRGFDETTLRRALAVIAG